MMINQAQTDNVSDELVATVEMQYWVELKEALDRLENNADFVKVIKEGYFRDKAINGVSLLAHPAIKDQGKRGDVMEQLVAISQLEDYFATVKAMGNISPDEDDEDTESEE